MPKRKMSIGPRAKFTRRKWLKPTFPNLGLFAGYEDPRRDEFIFDGEANSAPIPIVNIDGTPYHATPARKRGAADGSQGRDDEEGANDEADVGRSDDDETSNASSRGDRTRPRSMRFRGRLHRLVARVVAAEEESVSVVQAPRASTPAKTKPSAAKVQATSKFGKRLIKFRVAPPSKRGRPKPHSSS